MCACVRALYARRHQQIPRPPRLSNQRRALPDVFRRAACSQTLAEAQSRSPAATARAVRNAQPGVSAPALRTWLLGSQRSASCQRLLSSSVVGSAPATHAPAQRSAAAGAHHNLPAMRPPPPEPPCTQAATRGLINAFRNRGVFMLCSDDARARTADVSVAPECRVSWAREHATHA